MTQRIGVFGIGGMARETRDIADALGFSVVFVARNATELNALGATHEVIPESDIGRYSDMPYAIGIGEGAVRKRIAARYGDTLSFLNLIHPSATFGRGQRERVELARGVIVCAGVRLTSDITVGAFTLFNLNATVSHDSIIGDYSTLSPQACVLGNVELKSGVWVGAGATINQGPRDAKRVIGSNTVIGSGAVVLHDCDADSVYAGVPARKLK
jgi:sugar O-acyltransferase (sialic acid O-acetyltransferase NeuD family)